MNHKAFLKYQDRFWVVEGVKYFSELGFCFELSSINGQQENFAPVTIGCAFLTERQVAEALSKPKLQNNCFNCPSGDFLTERQVVEALSKPKLQNNCFNCSSGDQPSLLIE